MNRRVHLHTRQNLLDFVGGVVTRRAVLRALSEGTVEVLGGFNSIPPKGLPGWCLRVKSPITDQWYELGVTVEPGGTHRVWMLGPNGGIPWGNWIGGNDAFEHNLLMRGDNPDNYKERKMNATSTSTEEKGS